MPLCELRYFSSALQKHTAAMVLLPSPELEGPHHVMFLLHGLSDDYSIWLRRTRIEAYLDGIPLIVVMPDGGRGFYTDAAEGFAYEQAVAVELPALIRSTFQTSGPWCATGLSMGGYGALKLGLKYPDVFVSAASHSGALGFGHFPFDPVRGDAFAREFTRVLGPNPEGGKDDLFALASASDRSTKLRIDCGRSDFLLDANRAFHEHLNSIALSHEYEEFEGDHNWDYWDVHVREAIAFHLRNLG